MLEVNPGGETKLSGFTAVSGGWGGAQGQVSGFRFQVPRYFVPLR